MKFDSHLEGISAQQKINLPTPEYFCCFIALGPPEHEDTEHTQK